MPRSDTMMTADQILVRLAALKDIEVHIERGDYSSRDKWAVRIVYNNLNDGNLDRVSVEAKHANFAHALVEVWEKLERVALKGLGAAVLQPMLEHRETEVSPSDYRD